MTRVLIVEDHPENLGALRLLLEGHGYVVDHARHGAEALEKARISPPNLMISDVLMPVMNGFSLLLRWRADEQFRLIPFVVYSVAYTRAEDQRLALHLRPDAFIPRPSEPGPFLDHVREVMARTGGFPSRHPSPPADEATLFREYSEILVLKLEEKALQLETSNRAFVAEIGERQEVQAALRDSIARTELLIRSSGIGLWDWNLVNNEAFFSPAWKQQLGYTEPELVGGIMEWESRLHPDDREQSLLAMKDFIEGRRADYDVEFRQRHKDGSWRWIFARATLARDVDGRPVRMMGCHIDITDRKRDEAEVRLRDRAIRAVSQGIIITDARLPDHLITYVSPGFERLTGYSAGEAIGRNCRFLQGRDTDPAAVAQVSAALRAGRGCTVEMLNYRKDGSRFWNNLAISAVSALDGQISHFVGIQTDVTERRRLEEQFRQAHKMEAIGQLAGGVAHDFNNMLTIINGYCELVLDRTAKEDPCHSFLKQIQSAGSKAEELTRQLLTFSRQQVLQPKLINLNQVVGDTETMLRRLIGNHVALTTTLAADLSAVVADPGQVGQVLINLVVNAKDAMPDGGNMTLSTCNVILDAEGCCDLPGLSPGKYVVLTVGDEGCGMDGAVKARIFEPFFTTKEPGKGTGLGLATVHGIVEQAGGCISVRSEVGSGSTFNIYFPAAPQQGPPPPPPDSATPSPRGNETVLLVEDEPAVQLLAGQILRECGYCVLTANNGIEAIRISEGHHDPIHLLLSDVIMPRMGGREVAQRIVGTRPLCKVLFISGYMNDAVIGQGVLEAGYAFLQKPFTPLSLARKVRAVLDDETQPALLHSH